MPEGYRYQKIAAELRAQIVSGELPPGAIVPGAKVLAKEHAVGDGTALRAVGLLRREGLVSTGRDGATRVREPWPMQIAELSSKAVVYARMPTPRERRELGIEDGVPVLVVRSPEAEEVHPADRWQFIA